MQKRKELSTTLKIQLAFLLPNKKASQVLSWRYLYHSSSSSSHLFTGERDVAMVFFYFESVVIREEEEDSLSFELISHLDRLAFEIFSHRSATSGLTIAADEDFCAVKAAFIEAFSTKTRKNAQGFILAAMNATLDGMRVFA